MIHICTAADQNYILPLDALINSMVRNMPEQFTLHVLETGIPKSAQNKLKALCKGTQGAVEFINMAKYEWPFPIKMYYWTDAIYYRMAIPNIFPDIDRMLYIDGDTLVLNSLGPLYNIDMPDRYFVAMVKDRFSGETRNHISREYYNSGMILFDMKKCREFNLFNKCYDWLVKYNSIVVFPDQDALNAVLSGYIMRVPMIYNNQVVTDMLEKNCFMPDIVMLHFLGKEKPWMPHSAHWAVNIYTKYMTSKLQQIKLKIGAWIYKTLYKFRPPAKISGPTNFEEFMMILQNEAKKNGIETKKFMDLKKKNNADSLQEFVQLRKIFNEKKQKRDAAFRQMQKEQKE